MADESIREYILASKQNLGIAAAVGEAWPEARNHVVYMFLDKLKAKLEETLSGWTYETENSFFVHQESNFSLSKSTWRNQYWIVLHGGDYGRKIFFGVTRNEPELKNRPFNKDLLEAVKVFDSSATKRSWWEAQIRMRSPAGDWHPLDVLWRMHRDDTFLNEVAEQLLAVAKISEKIVDQMVQPTDEK